jgi:replicative DNA helicase
MSDKIPTCLPTEAALIGALLEEPDAIDEIEGHVTPAMLFDGAHSAILSAILRTKKAGREINVMTVMESLDASGGGHFVTRMFDITNSLRARDLGDLATEVRAVHQRREIIRACMELAARGHDLVVPHKEYVADVEARIAAVVGANVAKGEGLRKLDPHTAYEAIMETIKNKGRVGLSTSLRGLDMLTSGLGNGHVMVIGGLPGDGKTGLAIQMIEEAAMNRQRPIGFFSLEMPEEDIAKRLISRRSGISLASMRSGKIDAADIDTMAPAKKECGIAPVYIYDTPAPTIGTMRAEARRLKARVGDLALIVIDYLQLARGVTKTDSREQEVAEVSRGIKAMAKELGCPVVSLAQLNSDGAKRPNQRPRASDLRESKAIWQDADTVVLIHNPNRDKIDKGQTDEGERQLILDKNRHGACGVIDVKFDKTTATFLDLDGKITPWPSTTRSETPDYVGGRPNDFDGDGVPFDDEFEADRRWP